MTNAEIQVGEYVRTKNGIIGTLIEISKAGNGARYAGEYITDTIISIYTNPHKEVRVKDKEVKSHSENIIDLIEEGDYVNGGKVFREHTANGEEKLLVNFCYTRIPLKIVDIKTIVTKEQFEAMEYKVGGEDD